MQDIAQTYRNSSDDELIRLHADLGSLTDQARFALLAEIQRRNLSDATIAAQQEQWKQEATAETDAKVEKRKKPPVRWLKILAQIGIIIAVGILFVSSFSLIESHNLDEAAALGRLFVYTTLLNFSLALMFYQGRIKPTLIVTTAMYFVMTLFLLF